MQLIEYMRREQKQKPFPPSGPPLRREFGRDDLSNVSLVERSEEEERLNPWEYSVAPVPATGKIVCARICRKKRTIN